jgi:hypothetical protein
LLRETEQHTGPGVAFQTNVNEVIREIYMLRLLNNMEVDHGFFKDLVRNDHPQIIRVLIPGYIGGARSSPLPL